MAHFETEAIHAEREATEAYASVTVPIFQTSTFRLDHPGTDASLVYARANNPTRSALERSLATLEGASWAVAFASGMAATSAVGALLEPGAHVVATDDLYGGSFRLFRRLLGRHGVTVSFVDTSDPARVASALDERTRLVFVETPSNPLLRLTPLARVCDLAHDRGALVCVDNTFATPYLQRPLEHGADLVVHSTTKYLGGHSDLLGGAVIGNAPELFEEISLFQRGYGAVPGPLDCFLVLRGIKTLAVRMDRQAQSAAAVAACLAQREEVTEVCYPDPAATGLEKQMVGRGAMVSFRLRGGARAAEHFVTSLKVFTLAMSLGGVESLCEVPAKMTHAVLQESECAVPEDLVRLSIGLEHADDLVADVVGALDSLGDPR
ncbi:MAG TPA: aminotransferase class V-fold PLP-dependent enzyme [Acidimicrobiales bacterium]|nr:aminotransferase class V-fold PLP-dependent enzyme [Acidimicrobiales bacterium]